MTVLSTVRARARRWNVRDIPFLKLVSRGGLAIGDTGGIPGGPTRLGWSKIPAPYHHQPALSITSGTLNYFPYYSEHV